MEGVERGRQRRRGERGGGAWNAEAVVVGRSNNAFELAAEERAMRSSGEMAVERSE